MAILFGGVKKEHAVWLLEGIADPLVTKIR
jgi:hypothetical protein